MKAYTENYVSPFQMDTEEEALKDLMKIREAKPASKGWTELLGYVEKLPSGKWRAVRLHTTNTPG